MLNKKYLLILKEEGQEEELTEGTVEEIVKYLEENYDDLFSWINSSPWIDDGSPATELPELKNIEVLRELETELEKVDFSWWRLEVQEVEGD